jgi:hypothetical protein
MTQSAQHSTAIRSILLKSLLGISFAAVLALAPAPAFAQHGGGGGGGGSHGGGGGGGGSHASSGGGHASSGSGSHATSSGSSAGTSASTGGHWWNPFHGSGTNSGTAAKAGGTGAGTNATNSTGANAATHFAAGNNVWQEPPANAHANAPSHFYANSNHDAVTTTSRPLHRTMNNAAFASARISENRFHRRPIFSGPFFPFGFGFGSPFGFGYGFGFGCDPLWNWNCPLGYGFGYGAGFGYGGDFGYYGGATGMGYGAGSDMNFEMNGTEPNAGEDMSSPQGNAGEWQNAPDNSSQADVANAQPYVVIFLRDGTSYAVSDYWLAGGKLHYVTSYGGENSVDANQLDLQRTVNENASHGITFTLRPAPATDAPNGQQNLQPPPSNDGQTPAPNPQ